MQNRIGGLSPQTVWAPPSTARGQAAPVDRYEPQEEQRPDPIFRISVAERLRLTAAVKRVQEVSREQRPYYDAEKDAQAARTYYGDLSDRAKDMNASQLYEALSGLVESTHRPVDYDPSEHLYPWVDLRPDGKLHSIYSGSQSRPEDLIEDDFRRKQEFHEKKRDARERAAREGRDPFKAVRDIEKQFHLNCEHVVPQSWFDKRAPMRGDLHHLFTCDIDCNSTRGNLPYADLPGQPPGDCGKIGGDRFEPAYGKGAVARATLYFLLRYPEKIGDEPNEYSLRDVATLLKWHQEDPVAEYERHRNAAIEETQGNRNPLIDHPEWAAKIDWAQGIGNRRL